MPVTKMKMSDVSHLNLLHHQLPILDSHYWVSLLICITKDMFMATVNKVSNCFKDSRTTSIQLP